MVALYMSHIRPIMDYGSCVWNMQYLSDVRLLESTLRRWTREIVGVQTLSYKERLKSIGLYSVWGRLLRADLVKVWRAFHCDTDVGIADLFQLHGVSSTRGHSFKLVVQRCRTEVRRRSFALRVVQKWNALPPRVAEAQSINCFKSYLDDWLGDSLFDVV